MLGRSCPGMGWFAIGLFLGVARVYDDGLSVSSLAPPDDSVALCLTALVCVGYHTFVACDDTSRAHVPVAQWIERWFAEPKIGGSSPLGYTR